MAGFNAAARRSPPQSNTRVWAVFDEARRLVAVIAASWSRSKLWLVTSWVTMGLGVDRGLGIVAGEPAAPRAVAAPAPFVPAVTSARLPARLTKPPSADLEAGDPVAS